MKQLNAPPARTAPASFLRHATDVASFYGFRPAREIERMAQNRLVKRVGAHTFETVSHVSATRVAMSPGEPARILPDFYRDYITGSVSGTPMRITPLVCPAERTG